MLVPPVQLYAAWLLLKVWSGRQPLTGRSRRNAWIAAGLNGTILGACVLLSRIAVGDWLTGLVTLVSLVVLFRWKVSNPLLIAAAAMIGLIAFPLLQPPWVFVK